MIGNRGRKNENNTNTKLYPIQDVPNYLLSCEQYNEKALPEKNVGQVYHFLLSADEITSRIIKCR